MAVGLEAGDLVSHKDRGGDLFVVLGYTYRVSRWGNRRLMKLFCSTTGKQEYILEEQLIVVSTVKNKKNVDNEDNI
mgnify:FL=1|tara:strand:- start:242 stop:469 length:228 start_codon:yes stop_codon:yes gene_type:complete